MVPGLPDEVWQTLEDRLTIQQLKKGEFLVREGEICRHVSFINYGLVRIYYLTGGKEICTGFLGVDESGTRFSYRY